MAYCAFVHRIVAAPELLDSSTFAGKDAPQIKWVEHRDPPRSRISFREARPDPMGDPVRWVQIHLCALREICAWIEYCQKSLEYCNVGHFKYPQEPLVPLDGTAISIVTRRVRITGSRREALIGPEDAAQQHHQAGNIKDVADDADVARKLLRSPATVLDESDERDEENLEDVLQDQCRFDQSVSDCYLARLPVCAHADGGPVCGEALDSPAEDEKGAENPTRMQRGVVRQVCQQTAENEVFGGSVQRRAGEDHGVLGNEDADTPDVVNGDRATYEASKPDRRGPSQHEAKLRPTVFDEGEVAMDDPKSKNDCCKDERQWLDRIIWVQRPRVRLLRCHGANRPEVRKRGGWLGIFYTMRSSVYAYEKVFVADECRGQAHHPIYLPSRR